MQNMPSLLERKRLKDRIVESVSKAVKQIQEYQFSSGEADAVLTNHDWQFCKLAEHLDHAFLHGLRHITNGYWAVVQDFTHKATTKEIKRMNNVTTNLGRGRAWLYLALSEQLLESYLHCFISNLATVRRYYAKEALVLDQQRMEILLTLAAGLEFITFQLDVNVPYLDLASHMRPRLASQDDSLDRISLCSMDSTLSQSSSIADLEHYSGAHVEVHHSLRSENGFLIINEDEENFDPQKSTGQMTTSTSMPALSRCDQSRMERISKVPSSNSFNDSLNKSTDNETTLEVIHVKRTHRSKRSRNKTKKRLEANIDPDRISLTSMTSISSESSLQMKRTSEGSPSHSMTGEPLCSSPALGINVSHEKLIPNIDIISNQEQSDLEGKSEQYHNDSSDKCIKVENLFKENGLTDISKVDTDSVIVGNDEIDVNLETTIQELLCISETSDSGSRKEDENEYCGDITIAKTADFELRNHVEYLKGKERSTDSQHTDLKKVNMIDRVLDTQGGQSVKTEQSEVTEKPEENGEKDNTREINHPKTEDTVMISKVGDTKKPSPTHSDSGDKHPSEIKVDINYLLLLKLHVLQDDEEQLLKMYRTSLGHTEGEVELVFLLISSSGLYILTPSKTEDSLAVIAQLPFTEIDYILLGVGDQIITVVCTNRRRQFWITTGDETLTRHIINHIDIAVRQSPLDLPHLSILTEPTQQRIALRKWAAKESRLEMSETIVYTYALVHWCEVPTLAELNMNSQTRKEGMLLVRTNQSLLSTPSWIPHYFVLKDGMLYQYSDRLIGTPPKACVQLSGEECAGCRRSPHSDRSHSFELILANDQMLQLSARDANDAQDWLLSLCRAVAEGHQVSGQGMECLAGCCVVTQNSILVCHEDLQTNFFRTLGAARVTNVTCVLTDPVMYTYLVIAFENPDASDSSECWTLYFNAKGERDRFLESLGQAWKKQFQVTLPVSEMKDVAMIKHCREGQIRLQSGPI